MIWLLLILIIFIPLPIYISFEYIDNPFLFIYFIRIDLKKKIKHAQEQTKSKKNNINKKNSIENLKNALNKINNNYLKPTIRINFNLMYGFDDAAKVALCYGSLSSLSSLFFILINCFFKVKKYNYNIYPYYSKKTLKFKFKSIILINLVKIISMLFIFLINFKFKQKSKYEFN